MAEKSLQARIQNKCDTTANWAKATNFVPKKGEIIVYSDGGGTGIPKMKVGDGTTKVGSLKFIESDGKLSTGRKISLGTAVSSTATEFDGSKDITIPVESVSASYLSWGGRNIVADVSPIDAAMSYLHNPNRLQFANPAGITIEYSNDGGSTWLDYEAADQQKIGLVSGLNTTFYYGKRTSSDVTATTNDKLRITLDGFKIKCYTMLKTILINFSTEGASGCKVLVERALFGNQTSFETIGTYALDGWSGWNSIPWERSGFGGYEHQPNNTRIIRLTFSVSGIISTSSPRVFNIMFLGTTYWNIPSHMAKTGHIYDWDSNQNATFPAGITATSFNGPASSVSHSLSINGKTFNGSAAVDAGTVGIAYGGTGKTTRKEALTALLGQQHADDLNEAFEQSTYVWDNSTTNTPANYGTLISLLNSEDTHDNAHNWLTHIAIGTNDTLYWRQKINNGDFTNWKTILDSNNYSTYAATKDHNHDGTYLKTLPVASSSTLGGVKIGSGLTVAADGTISAAAAYTLPTASSSVKGGIKVGTGLTMSSETLNHSNSITAKTTYGSTATTASANGGSITVTDIKYDAQGHITGSTDRTITLSQTTYTLAGLMGSAAKGSATQPVYWNGSAWTNTTYTLGKSVPADAKFTDTVYTLPTASSTLGGVKTTSTVSATTGLTACPIIDGVVYYKDTNNTYTLAGLVGSTAIGTATNPIYWDGTKFVKTTYTLGKSVPADAKFTDTVYTLPTASSSTLGGIKLGTGLTATADGTVNVSGGLTQSETISIATTDWSGSGPYTATKTLTDTYDSTNHDVIISLPQMSSSDVAKYDAIASAKMVISACSGTSVTIVALGDKPTVPVSIAIMQV